MIICGNVTTCLNFSASDIERTYVTQVKILSPFCRSLVLERTTFRELLSGLTPSWLKSKY